MKHQDLYNKIIERNNEDLKIVKSFLENEFNEPIIDKIMELYEIDSQTIYKLFNKEFKFSSVDSLEVFLRLAFFVGMWNDDGEFNVVVEKNIFQSRSKNELSFAEFILYDFHMSQHYGNYGYLDNESVIKFFDMYIECQKTSNKFHEKYPCLSEIIEDKEKLNEYRKDKKSLEQLEIKIVGFCKEFNFPVIETINER